MQQVIENCLKCGKKHNGVCYRESGACFKCGQMGHCIKNCPALKSELWLSLMMWIKGQKSKDGCLPLLGKVTRKLSQVSSPYFLLLSETMVAKFMLVLYGYDSRQGSKGWLISLNDLRFWHDIMWIGYHDIFEFWIGDWIGWLWGININYPRLSLNQVTINSKLRRKIFLRLPFIHVMDSTEF